MPKLNEYHIIEWKIKGLERQSRYRMMYSKSFCLKFKDERENWRIEVKWLTDEVTGNVNYIQMRLEPDEYFTSKYSDEDYLARFKCFIVIKDEKEVLQFDSFARIWNSLDVGKIFPPQNRLLKEDSILHFKLMIEIIDRNGCANLTEDNVFDILDATYHLEDQSWFENCVRFIKWKEINLTSARINDPGKMEKIINYLIEYDIEKTTLGDTNFNSESD